MAVQGGRCVRVRWIRLMYVWPFKVEKGSCVRVRWISPQVVGVDQVYEYAWIGGAGYGRERICFSICLKL